MPLSDADTAAPSLEAPAAPVASPQADTPPASPQGDIHGALAFAAKEYGVDQNVLAGMMMRESNLDPDVINGTRKSSAGAIGLMQFMPGTAKRFGIDPTDPVQSVFGAAAYMRANLDKFDGDYKKAIAAYNWGEGNVEKQGLDKAPDETRKYVDFVTQFASALGSKAKPDSGAGAGGGRGAVNPAAADPTTELTPPSPSSFPVRAAAAIPGNPGANTAPTPEPETSMWDKAKGLGEAAVNQATGFTTGAIGMAGGAIGGAVGAAATALRGGVQPEDGFEQAATEGADKLTYTPKTATGLDYAEKAGSVVAQAIPLMAHHGEMNALHQAAGPIMQSAGDVARRAGLPVPMGSFPETGKIPVGEATEIHEQPPAKTPVAEVFRDQPQGPADEMQSVRPFAEEQKTKALTDLDQATDVEGIIKAANDLATPPDETKAGASTPDDHPVGETNPETIPVGEATEVHPTDAAPEPVDPAEAARMAKHAETTAAESSLDMSNREQPSSAPAIDYANQTIAKAAESRINAARAKVGGEAVKFDAVQPPAGRPEFAAARALASLFGKKTVFVKFQGDHLFNGMMSTADGRIYLNVEAQRPVMAVLGHELLHALRNDSPEIYNTLAARLDPIIKGRDEHNASLGARYEEAGHPRLSEDKSTEELHADIVGDHFTDPTFLRQLIGNDGQSAGLGQAILKFLDNTIQKITKLRPFGTEQYLTDLQRARGHVADALNSYARDRGAAEAARSGPDSFSLSDDKRTPAIAKIMRSLTPEERERVTDRSAAKIVEQMKQLPSASEFAAVAHAGSAKRGWYKGSAEAIAHVFGPADAPRFAKLLAAMSPQTGVEANLYNALSTWKNWVKAGRPEDPREIRKIMGKSVQGRGSETSVLPAWINNSITALTHEEPHTVPLSGPKVDSFGKNLLGNMHEVTNDSWMSNFALVDQKIFAGSAIKMGEGKIGVKGPGYLAMNARVREAAAQLTKLTGEKWTPAEVQETIWSWAKALYEMSAKDGESRSAREILNDKALTDELINATPDFGSLFHNPTYAKILKDAGYGKQIDELQAGRQGDPAGADGASGAGARGKAGPFADDTQSRYEQAAARRLEQLHAQRGDAKLASRERNAEAALEDARLESEADEHLSIAGRDEEAPDLRVAGEQGQDARAGAGEEANAEKATPDDFSKDKITGLLGKRDWAVLTAENPMGKQATPEANAAAQARLKADLDAIGAQYQPARGKYGNEENSLAVTNIAEKDAIALGKKYDQDSVLTRKGLQYQDGRVTPATGVERFEKEPDDYYSTINGHHFAVQLDFDKTTEPTGSSTEHFDLANHKDDPVVKHVGLIGRTMESVRKVYADARYEILMNLSPMSLGDSKIRNLVSRWANSDRVARYQWETMDRIITKNFTPEERKLMWDANDEQSVIAQQLADGTRKEQAGPDEGLNRLSPKQRAAVETLQRYGEELMNRAVAAGMFDGTRIPHWTPRMAMMLDSEGNYTRPDSPLTVGKDVTTSAPSLKQRKYLTADETEAAMKARMDNGDKTAVIVKDIRTMPMAMARMERAIGGRELINGVKDLGTRIGTDLVSHEQRAGFVEMKHSAFTTYRAIATDQHGEPVFTRVNLWVPKGYEGPLKAIVYEKPGVLYSALMKVKSESMNALLYSPLTHLQVVFGRVFPVMPLRSLSIGFWKEGLAAMKDPATMSRFIDAGLVKFAAHGSLRDLGEILDPPGAGRGLLTRALGNTVGLVNKAAGEGVKRGLDKTGDFVHGTLLWDRVAQMQMGVALHAERQFTKQLIARGIDPDAAKGAATIMASHIANRYTGAIPNESMSAGARKFANITLFSRSFTLGNLGAMKDMITGLPESVKSQIVEQYGQAAMQGAKSLGRQKAVKAFILDMGMMYVANSLAQDVAEKWRKDQAMNPSNGIKGAAAGAAIGIRGGVIPAAILGAVGYAVGQAVDMKMVDKYMARFHEFGSQLTSDPMTMANHPWNAIAGLTSQGHNEPGLQDRVRIGTEKDGTATYMRLSLGKTGEDFKGWLSDGAHTLINKSSQFVKPALEIGHQAAYGEPAPGSKPLWAPSDSTLQAMGKAVVHIGAGLVPVEDIKNLSKVATGTADDLTKTKMEANLAGFPVRKGFPGGPVNGQMFRDSETYNREKAFAMPEIKELIKSGDPADRDAALEKMRALKMTGPEMMSMLKSQIAPAARQTSKSVAKDIMHGGSADRLQELRDQE